IELIACTLYKIQTLELTYVIYIKGFLISILGLTCYYIELIYFNSSRDILYRR
ncbi:hypothetical protein K458DRAFT_295109, partial [Lentithecium fluviatile CBS 122367]